MRKVRMRGLCEVEREEEPPRDRRAVSQGERAAGVAEAHRRDREEDPVHRPVSAASPGDASEEAGDGPRAEQAVPAERGDGGRVRVWRGNDVQGHLRGEGSPGGERGRCLIGLRVGCLLYEVYCGSGYQEE